jgi:single-stranded-DNA-specific exonuclease
MLAGRPWLDPPSIAVPEALRNAVGGHPLVAETLVRRGFSDPEAAAAFLDPARYSPTPASALPGIARVVTRLGRAIRGQERVCVWGDFDVDGQTATALLVACLADLGANVTYHVPVRETEGHGVRLPALEQVIDAGSQLILTCDTGISASDAVEYARSRGVDVIITDHHDLPPVIPDALAVVSTKLVAEHHPLRDLPGVGIAYKLSEALYEWARRPADAERNLDLAALGIVADLALLAGDTRYLLQRGLACLRRTNRLGLQVLLESAQLDPAHLSEEHIGFVLAPRLNAAGRLADANPCVELLTLGVRGVGQPATAEQMRQDLTRARIIAADLNTLNARRKLECDNVERASEAQISRDPALLDAPALVLDSPLWPAGIIGIVASRLVEEYGKPAILISTAGGIGRASARSVEGLHITEAIARQADLLAGFGGHPMAAGFTIEPDRIPEFRRAFNRTVAEVLPGPRASGALQLDFRLPLAELSLELAADLGRLAPFGPGNPPLTLLAERLTKRSSRQVGRNDEHRILLVADEAGNERQVIWWDGGDEETPEGLFDLAYVARTSTYRGQRDVQVELIATRPSAGAEIVVAAAPAYEVIDHRGTASPRAALDAVLAEGGEIAVWREEEAGRDIAGHDRRDLPRAASLAIWTTPPGPAELRAALAAVKPQRVYLFAIDPESGRPDAFLRRLAGLVNHVMVARAGRASIAGLAAATAQRESTVRLGLALLAALGRVEVVDAAGDEVRLSAATDLPAPARKRQEFAARLELELSETAAYRSYFRSANKDSLFRPIKR